MSQHEPDATRCGLPWAAAADVRLALVLRIQADPEVAALAPLRDLPAPGPDTGEFEVRTTERAAAADLAAMLRLCEAGKLRCGDKTERPMAAATQLV